MYTRALHVDHPDPTVPIAGNPKMPINQRPVPHQINQVRGNQRKHHRLRHIHALQIAPENKIKQQRQSPPRFKVRKYGIA